MIDPQHATQVLPPGQDRTAAWMKERRHGVGGSEIAGCVGAHPYTTPLQIWQEKLGRPRPPIRVTDAMLAGIAAEPIAASVYAQRNGVEVTTTGMWRSVADPLAFANPDRLITGDGGLEIKSHTEGSCAKWRYAKEPPYFVRAQAQWGMYVTGLRRWRVLSWCLANARIDIVWTLDYDPDMVAYLISGRDALWRCVTEGTPPFDGGDVDGLAALHHPPTTEGSVVVDPRLSALRDQWEDLTARRADHAAYGKALDAEAAGIRAEIAAILGGNETGLAEDGGDPVVTWKTSTAHRIDVKALREEDPETANRWTVASTSRRLDFPS